MNPIKNSIGALAMFCLAISASTHAQESNRIESINAAQQGGDIVVKIDFKAPLSAPPAGFSISNPARIALDFASTSNGTGQTNKVLNQSDLTSAQIIEAEKRTRVVLNLLRPLNYETRIDGNSLLVSLKPGTSAAATGSQTRFSESDPIIKSHRINDITFRRGKDGEARIVVDLSDAGTGIDIRQQGTALLVDFQKTTAGETLLRKLDVTDFATPVTSITSVAQADSVRMTIIPKGLWEHYAYQTEKQFVIEVRPIIENPNKLVQGSRLGYQGPRVSINYQNGDVRALLRLMAEELGLNAVISETVTGTTTLVLKDVPADQVIDIVFQQKGLDMRKNGNVILIAPRDEISTREKLEYEAKQQINDLEPLQFEAIQLNYQKAADIQKLLTGSGEQGLLSKRGKITADPVSNNIFISDIATKIDEIRKFIKTIDTGSQQVLIEARIVEANDSFNENLGIRLNFLNSKPVNLGGGGIHLGGGKYSSTGQQSDQSIGINLPSATSAGATIGFSLFNADLTRILNLELNALESDGSGKIISSPRVITANNVKAKIEDGTEVPIVTPGSANSPATVTFKSAKLSLETTPQITPEGKINLKILVKKEEPDWTRTVQGNPPIQSSTVETSVVIDNGGTVVIGGVFLTKSQNTTDKVPVLGDIPVLGWMFKNKINISSRRELLVFITPRVINENLRLK